MSELQLIDHSEKALSRQLWQFKESPNFSKLLNIYALESQEVEDTLQDLLYNRSVFTATGINLDIVGNLVGETRKGRPDDPDYRQAILRRIARNTSDATPEIIMGIILSMTQATKTCIWEYYPVNACYLTNGSKLSDIENAVQEASPATSGNVSILSVNNRNTCYPPDILFREQHYLVDQDQNEIGAYVGNLGGGGFPYEFPAEFTNKTIDNIVVTTLNKEDWELTDKDWELGILPDVVEVLTEELIVDTGENVTTDTGDILQVKTDTNVIDLAEINKGLLAEVYQYGSTS